ncbi:MAG: IclR family transcriptional regulator [Armatimonadota bacterium]|nr:IclR family transcriptional regulator [Armatimonadota bacterium]MDR7428311.1 IclR family transcriptional regulator [Armatimonadota bacterium]MDR7463422.1 IclR family transcriptional regulator [Armatimonadota bacterium]MDR7470207.1 IclR family transcriptional regulator [Armatimonadota bacterium]MDR7475559.1 IclR family transcriptional regulator [Armatimonadota bacterium]
MGREQRQAGGQERASSGTADRDKVKSLNRAFTLLMALGQASRPLSVAELIVRTGLPRPTVYRLVHTLELNGAVVASDGRYAIGPRVLWLAGRRLGQIELRAAGRPHLVELARRTGETAHLAVLEQGQVVYIDKVESGGPLRMASTVGAIMPAHCTALGKSMLAFLPPAQLQEVLRTHGLPRRTANTITDPARLLAELAAVRARGYAIDNVENEEGIRCVGAPIMDHRGQVAGAISVSGSVATITLERARRELSPLVREAAQHISRTLGWTQPPVRSRGGEP